MWGLVIVMFGGWAVFTAWLLAEYASARCALRKAEKEAKRRGWL